MGAGAPASAGTAIASTTAWQVTGARHAGITVSDLDRSLEFYPDGYIIEFHEPASHLAAP
jgi:hypothetical protein